MDLVFSVFLILHIVGGATGLLSGSINLIRHKGDRIHKRIGHWFVIGMVTAAVSAIVLSVLNPNYFLLIVGIFTLYMVGTAYRYILIRSRQEETKPKLLDWILTVGMGLVSILFFGLGIFQLIKGNTFGIVYIVFGLIGGLFVRMDFNNYTGKSGHFNYWMLAHIQRMTGGFIAALTAFLVVNLSNISLNIPPLVFWLLPTVILTPLIIKWSRKNRVAKKGQ